MRLRIAPGARPGEPWMSFAPMNDETARRPGAKGSSVDSYRIHVPDEVLADLSARLELTRFPDYFSEGDWDMGIDVPYIRELVAYWRSHFDWRAYEDRLNRLPHYTTTIDNQNIHFIHVRSPRPNALPLLMVHGWPGSVIEFRKVVDRLADPPRDAGEERQAFHLVIPSLPGYGFSGPTRERGWNIERTVRAFAELMRRLGYGRYGAQGGDWGAMITTRLAELDEPHVVGLHTNMPIAPAPEKPGDLTGEEAQRLQRFEEHMARETGYARIQGTKPQTVGLALNDSPAGLLGWIVEKFRTWSDCGGDLESVFSRDDLIANVMTYWATQTAASAARFYFENHLPEMDVPDGVARVSVPTGVARFPRELVLMPRSWLERRYNIVHWTEMDRGGHFAAMEQPELFAKDVTKFFTALR